MRHTDLPHEKQARPEQAFLVYLNHVEVVLDGFCLTVNDFGVMPNDIEVIIGGNGAGKTTICDVISGKTRPTRGRVFVRGTDVTKRSESDIAQRGVGRKFQTPRVFNSLSVFGNMELALPNRTSLWSNMIRRTTATETARIHDTLASLNLDVVTDKQAGALSHGQRQWLELAMLTLGNPDLLLVDEPAAGLTPQEVEQTAGHLLKLRQRHAMIVIEHNMDFVRSLGARVTFLDKGSPLDSGEYEAVFANPAVQEAYWGAAPLRSEPDPAPLAS